MALEERHLAVILQACVDFAGQLLAESGGFLPFGARGKPSGEIEFFQLARESDDESLAELYQRIGATLAEEARRDEILGAALVANATLAGDAGQTVVAIQIEAPGFCRSITVPYRIDAGAVAWGQMIPEEAQPAVFAV